MSDAAISESDLLLMLDNAADKAEREQILKLTNFNQITNEAKWDTVADIQNQIVYFEICDRYSLSEERKMLAGKWQNHLSKMKIRPSVQQEQASSDTNNNEEFNTALLTLLVVADESKNIPQLVSSAKKLGLINEQDMEEVPGLFIENFIENIAKISEYSPNFKVLITIFKDHFLFNKQGNHILPASESVFLVTHHLSLPQCKLAFEIFGENFLFTKKPKFLTVQICNTPFDKLSLFSNIHNGFLKLKQNHYRDVDISTLEGIQDFITWFKICKDLKTPAADWLKDWLWDSISKLPQDYHGAEYLELLEIAEFSEPVMGVILKRASEYSPGQGGSALSSIVEKISTSGVADETIENNAIDNLRNQISNGSSFSCHDEHVLSAIISNLKVSQLEKYFYYNLTFLNTLPARVFHEVMCSIGPVGIDKIEFAFDLFENRLENILIKIDLDFFHIMRGISFLKSEISQESKKSKLENPARSIRFSQKKQTAFARLGIKLNKVISSSKDVNTAFLDVLPEFADALYDALGTVKIASFIENDEDFDRVCEYLPVDRKVQVYRAVKDKLANSDFKKLIHHIPVDEIESACKKVKQDGIQYTAADFDFIFTGLANDVTNLVIQYLSDELLSAIDSAEGYRVLTKNLMPEQCQAIVKCLIEAQKLKEITKTPKDFYLILSALFPLQQNSVYEYLKANILAWFKDTQDLSNVYYFFKALNPRQCQDLCEHLKAINVINVDNIIYLTQEIPRENAEVILRVFLDTPEKFKAMGRSLGEKEMDGLYDILKPQLPAIVERIHQFEYILDCLSSKKREVEKNNMYPIFRNKLQGLIKNKNDVKILFQNVSSKARSEMGLVFIRLGLLCKHELYKTKSLWEKFTLKIFSATVDNIEVALIELFELMPSQPQLRRAWQTVCDPYYGVEYLAIHCGKKKLIIHGRMGEPSLNQQMYRKEKPNKWDEKRLSFDL